MRSLNRAIAVTVGLGALAAAALVVCPMIGLTTITPWRMAAQEELRFIFWSIRVPRVLSAFCAGGVLAVAGMIYQALFRNPLADPYTLGVSSGASLGAALCIVAGAGGSVLGLSVVTLGAFAGALGAIAVVYCFAWSREANSTTLLLAGVIVATLCSGCIMFIHFVGGVQTSFRILRWIMGGVDGVSMQMFLSLLVPVVLFLCCVSVMLPRLDLFLTGDSIAHSRGVNVRASRGVLIAVTALAVGGVVAVCGPIGFVGIIAPHVCRLVMPGVRHRLLAVGSFLCGGSFLVVADALARSIAPPAEVPVGIITALAGGPFFLLLLLRQKHRLLM